MNMNELRKLSGITEVSDSVEPVTEVKVVVKPNSPNDKTDKRIEEFGKAVEKLRKPMNAVVGLMGFIERKRRNELVDEFHNLYKKLEAAYNDSK